MNKWKEIFALTVIYKKILKTLTKKYTECKICNSNRSVKRFYENKGK